MDFAHHQLQGDWRAVAHGQWETWAAGQGPAELGADGDGSSIAGGAAAAPLAAMGWVGRDGLPGQLDLLSPAHTRYSQRQPDVRRLGNSVHAAVGSRHGDCTPTSDPAAPHLHAPTAAMLLSHRAR